MFDFLLFLCVVLSFTLFQYITAKKIKLKTIFQFIWKTCIFYFTVYSHIHWWLGACEGVASAMPTWSVSIGPLGGARAVPSAALSPREEHHVEGPTRACQSARALTWAKFNAHSRKIHVSPKFSARDHSW